MGEARKPNSRLIWCLVFLLFATIGLCVACVVLIVQLQRQVEDLQPTSEPVAGTAAPLQECTVRETAHHADTSVRSSVFDPLSQAELREVRDYLFASFNLSRVLQAKPNQSYIHYVDLFKPNKSEVTAHLDLGASRPERQALAVLVLGSERRVLELVVGPLPSPRYHREYKNSAYKRPKISSTALPRLLPDEIQRYTLMKQACDRLRIPLKETFEMECCPFGVFEDCIQMLTKSPYGDQSGEVHAWYIGIRSVEGESVHPLPFEMLVNSTDDDYTKWSVAGIYYDTKVYDSVDDFLLAYNSNNTAIKWLKRNPTYSSMSKRGQPLPNLLQPGPRIVEPAGHRYTVQGHHISYMDWKLNFGASPVDGVQLYNIRYRGERILYELGMKEAIAQYGGSSPGGQHSKFYDVSFLMGNTIRPLHLGVDCPETATLLHVNVMAFSEDVREVPRAICIFEHLSSIPQRSHFSTKFAEQNKNAYSGAPDYYLVVRSILTVWNYDYVFDYMLHIDGIVEVKVGLTGYIQSEAWRPGAENYGFEIAPGVLGNIHNHVLNFKADFDIEGTANRFVTYEVEPERFQSRYRSDPPINYQRKITRNVRRTEKEAAIKFDFDKPMYYVVESKSGKTRPTKLARGYRIHLGNPSKFVVPLNETSSASAARWSEYQISSTLQKEEERSSTTPYNQNEPYHPLLDFQDFLDDDENIDGQDLVTWLSIGLMHIPHTEDLPVTTTSAATIGFKLMPYNYFDEDPSMGMRDAVQVVPGKGKESQAIEEFSGESCSYTTSKDDAFPNTWVF